LFNETSSTMTAEDTTGDIDKRNKSVRAKEEVRRSRTVAVVLAGFIVITLLAVVYALAQQTEAKKQEAIAIQIREKSLELEQRLRLTIEEANRQRSIAEAERLIAIKTLEDCKSSQKKK
jgi:hypothetical protein